MKTNQRFMTMMLALVAMLMGTKVMAEDEKKAYVVYEPDNSSLVFYYDSERNIHAADHMVYDLNEGANMPGWSIYYISSIEFDKSFEEARPTTTYHWINSTVSNIIGLEYLNTSEVTNMGEMFRGCILLESIDLSHFNTSKVTNMFAMFCGCIYLKELDVSKFDTSQVTELSAMFANCSQLEELNVSNFQTGNVLYMQEMFARCSSLKTLDLKNFDTSKVVFMGSMFEGCTVLNSVVLSSFDTSNVVDMQSMFSACRALTELDLSSFNTGNVKYISTMFMFNENLKTVYVGDEWNMSSVMESNNMFADCYKLVGGAGTAYINDPAFNYTYARIDGGPESPGYFTYKKPSGISTGNLQVISDKSQVTSDEWNTIDGKKIGGKPTKRGVYIHNGKKVVVR